MSFTATASFSSPGSMGTPMYWARSEVSRVSTVSVVMSLLPCLRNGCCGGGRIGARGAAGETGFHEPHELGVTNLGVAAGHRYLAIGEEEHLLGHLVRG